VLLVAGFLSVALGLVGMFVPVLPTTPFLLLAAACFVRASPTLHRRLVESAAFGPLIVEWERHRSIPWRTKLTAIALMSASIAASIVFFVRPWPLQVALGMLGIAVGTWLYRVPSRDRPRRRTRH
jgi:uncharacterized membrane protein YbaN (DUF454 family)